jgi:hypothetical protein
MSLTAQNLVETALSILVEIDCDQLVALQSGGAPSMCASRPNTLLDASPAQ